MDLEFSANKSNFGVGLFSDFCLRMHFRGRIVAKTLFISVSREHKLKGKVRTVLCKVACFIKRGKLFSFLKHPISQASTTVVSHPFQ
jgi:hypothetical protein